MINIEFLQEELEDYQRYAMTFGMSFREHLYSKLRSRHLSYGCCDYEECKQVAEQLGISPLMVEEYCEFSDLDCRLF